MHVGTHFLKALCVCCTNEVGLHVVDSSLGVHQILVILAFNLNHAHDNAIDHVDGLAFIILSLGPFLVVFDAFAVFHLILYALSPFLVFEYPILNACASLIEYATIQVSLAV